MAVVFSFQINSAAQNFVTNIYNNGDGLVSNLTKSIVQDNDGYIWIATDGGLSRFDGKKFLNFKKGLPSFFIKDLLETKSGKMLIATDMGIGYFEQSDSGYVYKNIAKSSLQESNEALYYPKQLFQANDSSYWVSDLTGISHISKGSFKKYKFDKVYDADSYFRSFLVAETEDNKIIAASRTGTLFYYDADNDSFQKLNYDPPSDQFTFDALVNIGNSTFLAGSSDGIYRIKLGKSISDISVDKISNVKNISSIVLGKSGKLFVGTWTDNFYFGSISGGKLTLSRFDNYDFGSIKNLFIDRTGNLWVCSDRGIGLVRKTVFHPIEPKYFGSDNLSLYAQQIKSFGDKIYFSNGNDLFQVDKNSDGFSLRKIIEAKDRRILSFDVGKSGIWVTFTDRQLVLFDKNGSTKLFSKYFQDDRPNDLFTDSKGNLWSYFPREYKILKIDQSYNLSYYNLSYHDLVYINLFKQASNGTIYCAGSGIDSYLFKLDKSKNEFINISPKIDFATHSPIEIFDLDFKNNITYLASSYGVLRVNRGNAIRDNQFKVLGNEIIRGIKVSENGSIWAGTDRGVYVTSNGELVHFNSRNGLPNSAVASQGLLSYQNKYLFVATSSGLAYCMCIGNAFSKTPKPVLEDVHNFGNRRTLKSNKNEYISGENLEFAWNSLIFPADKIEYQYRLLGADTSWSLNKINNSVNFYNLSSGDYTFEVRAKNNGYLMSDAAIYHFAIVRKWYLSNLMLAIYLLFFIIFIIFSVKFWDAKRIRTLRQRENELAQLVNERTDDLLIAKEKTESLLEESENAKRRLEEANEQRSNLLNIAAHDLKNPLQAIRGFSSIINEESYDEDSREMAKMIYDSAEHMVGQIDEMLEAAAMESKNVVLDKRSVDVNKFMDELVKENESRANQKRQILITNYGRKIYAEVDLQWIKVAVNNLISNAIKYSENGKTILVSTSKDENNIYIQVKDQGQGLSSDDMRKLFNKYQRLSAKPTGGETSTGLGLSIVKDIIDKHDGKIWADSELGKGSIFTISLPLNENLNGNRA